MKKRILGLALALIMVISLLPLTTLAETELAPMPKFVINDPNLPSRLEDGLPSNKTVYVIFEDVKDEAGAVIGNKPVIATDIPADNYIKMEFVDGVCQITFKNIKYKRTEADGDMLSIYENKDATNKFDVVLTLEGENTVEGKHPRLTFSNTGNVTITGSGSLVCDLEHTSNLWIQKKNDGDLIFKDTTVKATLTNTSTGGTGAICAAGNIIIDNSTVEVTGSKCYILVNGTKYSTKLTDTTKGITIKNGSNVTVVSGSVVPVYTNGPIKVENSNVEISKSSGNTSCFASSIPYATGVTVQLKKAAGKTPYEYKDFADYEIAEGTAINKDDHKFIAYKAVHECTAQADDGDCSTPIACVCGKAFAEAKQHAGVITDCAKDTKCTNEGCTKLFAAAGTHEAGEDDGDCTTAIKCKNCEAIATPAADAHKGGEATCTAKAKCETCGKEYGELKAHTYTRTDCSVDAVCTVCNEVVAKGGEHAGGTATCKDKAKCTACGAEYGELAACKPAADDGDCTTAIKCTICGKEITAGQDAHKFTDNADTACDNEGCAFTRTVEAPTTTTTPNDGEENEGNGNNQTGDNTPLVLFVSLMVASAAAFVCIKKFAVR